LNYSHFFSEGQSEVSAAEDYTSENTRRLNVEEMMEMLLKLDCMHHALQGKAVTA